MWRVFLIALLLLPFAPPAHAEGNVLIVNNDITLQGVTPSYDGIVIKAGATLHIVPGTEVAMEAGASITGQGNLSVRATAELPALFVGTNWKGIDISGNVEMFYAQLLGAQGPFHFAGQYTVLDNTVFQDIPDTTIHIDTSGTGFVAIRSVAIRRTILESQSIGFFITGDNSSVDILNLEVPRFALIKNINLINVQSGYHVIHVNEGKSLDGCYIINRVIGVLPGWRQFEVNPECHPKEPSLLFVPGYGTSLNFSYLLNPQPSEPSLDGWSFLPLLTDSYTQFLNDAKLRSIPYSVAYYDWRRKPADIVNEYLIPAIDALKRRDNTDTVYIVAHSFGGIVARSYIESGAYRDDVAGFAMLGTPNRGSVKAYAPWEGDILPDDWQPVSHLIRWYHYLQKESIHSDLSALRTFIPSAQAMLPIDTVLDRGFGPLQPIVNQQNTELLDLDAGTEVLRNRIPLLFTVAGTGYATGSKILAGSENYRADYWPDGEEKSESLDTAGDGTVTLAAAQLVNVPQKAFTATHAALPAIASSYVLDTLYPTHTVADHPTRGILREARDLLWFMFDCPVDVSLTSPSGHILSSNPGITDTTAVFSNSDVTWMLLPREEGVYSLRLSARADTEVRWWQGIESIHTYNMKEGEVRTISYVVPKSVGEQSGSSPSPLIQAQAEGNSQDPPSDAQSSEAIVYITKFSLLGFRPFSPILFESISLQKKFMHFLVHEHVHQPLRIPYGAFVILFAWLLRRKAQRQSHSHHPP